MEGLPEVHIQRKGANRIHSGHPWIFRSDVADAGAAQAGDVVLVSDGKRTLGVAHYSAASQIALRMISNRVEAVDGAFLLARIREASEYRQRVVRDSNAFRIVSSEADQLPGLIIDRYGDYLAVQTLTQGMDRLLGTIGEILQAEFGPLGIIARNDSAVRSREALPSEIKPLHGEVPESVPITMNGLHLSVDLAGGQKTGVFLDQRENYLAARRWARGRVLDCFTCTGGFALHMADACDSVEAVDSSESALKTAERNRQSNALANIQFRRADVFDLLAGHVAARRRFDTIVLDPPAFAKSRSTVEPAMRAYKEINLRAMRLLPPGGILITCSCSHHVSEADLLQVLAESSLDANRRIRVIERRSQALDHPVLLTVPETLYLKCLVLEVLANR